MRNSLHSRHRRPRLRVRLLLTAAVASVASVAAIAGAGTANAATPAHRPSAVTVEAIRGAYAQAFTGNQKPATTLAAVEDGAHLTRTLEQVTMNYPTAVRTAELMTGKITVAGRDRATVRFHITYEDGIDYGPRTGTAVRVHGQWKVGRATFCTVMGWAGASCP